MEAAEKKKQTRVYWLITLVSTAICVWLLIYWSEWFWVMLPFVLTYLVKAVDRM